MALVSINIVFLSVYRLYLYAIYFSSQDLQL